MVDEIAFASSHRAKKYPLNSGQTAGHKVNETSTTENDYTWILSLCILSVLVKMRCYAQKCPKNEVDGG